MPKYIYDPKLNAMVPQQKRGIDYALTGEGLRITDHDKKVEFVITRDNQCKLPARRINFDCKLYDTNTARQIAGRVQRIYPQSKYKDWRFFAKGFRDPYDYDIEEQMTPEDKALLRSISESYGTEDVMNYIDHLDEGHIFSVPNAQSSHMQTPGTTEHGLKGFVNALPAAIISFLVCPPAAILGWFGAVHERAEKRWLKTRINPNRWLDFVATPWEKKKKIRDKIRDEMAKNCKYYYTRLANGEILRVVGCSTLEAKEMIMAVEHKDIIPRYAEWNRQLRLTAEHNSEMIVPPAGKDINYTMWAIIFDNGETCYAFGAADCSDKEDIMEKAIESREAIVKYYKKIVYRDEDNQDKKKQKHPVGIDKERDEESEAEKRLFAVPKIDDMIKIENPSSYKIINDVNYKEFSEPSTSPLRWNPASKTVYRFNIGSFAQFTLPLLSDLEAKAVCEYLVENQRSFAQRINAVKTFYNDNKSNVSFVKCMTDNRDYIYLPVHTNADHSVANVDTRTSYDIDESKVINIANQIFEAISEAIDESNVVNPQISVTAKKDYNANYKKGNKVSSKSPISLQTYDNEGDEIKIYSDDWVNQIKYVKLDSRTGEALSNPVMYHSNISQPSQQKPAVQSNNKPDEKKNQENKPADSSIQDVG